MSMATCRDCRKLIDTDDDPEAIIEHKYGDYFQCKPCREKHEAYNAQGDCMAALAEDQA
jgi:hypothetical protein